MRGQESGEAGNWVRVLLAYWHLIDILISTDLLTYLNTQETRKRKILKINKWNPTKFCLKLKQVLFI